MSRQPRASGYFRTRYEEDLALAGTRLERTSLAVFIVALLAALVGAGLSRLLGPLFPMQVIVPAEAFIALPVIAVVIGLIASATGLRRAVSVDPAIAFGGP